MDEVVESVPLGWEIDELRGELCRVSTTPDPLPHVAVRASNGGVRVICEPGLHECRAVLDVIRRVVPRYFGKSRVDGNVQACRLELEGLLARLALRGEIRPRPPVERRRGHIRVWAPAA